MKYFILVLVLVLFFIGCSSETSEYRDFVQKYGSETRTYCDEKGFKMRETFMSREASAPQVFLINSQDCR